MMLLRRMLGWPLILLGLLLGGPFIVAGALLAGVKRREVQP